jgi:hypothetical protein
MPGPLPQRIFGIVDLHLINTCPPYLILSFGQQHARYADIHVYQTGVYNVETQEVVTLVGTSTYDSMLNEHRSLVQQYLPRPIKDEYTCPICGEKMVLKEGKYGPFWGCSRFPECGGLRNLKGKPNRATIAQTKAQKKKGLKANPKNALVQCLARLSKQSSDD